MINIPHGGIVFTTNLCRRGIRKFVDPKSGAEMGKRMKADRKNVDRLLKTARGQLDGILKMVEEDRYCVDISNQIMATQSILTKVNREVLKAHMQCCVKEAVQAEDHEEKVNEIMALMDKLIK